MQIWSTGLFSLALAFFGLEVAFGFESDPAECAPKAPFWGDLINKVSSSTKPHLPAQAAVISAEPVESPRGLWTDAQIPIYEFEKFKGASFGEMLTKLKADTDVIIMESHPSNEDLDFLRGQLSTGTKIDDRLYQPQAFSDEPVFRMSASADQQLSHALKLDEVLDQSFRRVMARGAFIPPGAEFAPGYKNTEDKPILLYKICDDPVLCATKTTLIHERLRAYIHEFRQKNEKNPLLRDPHYALAREFEIKVNELALSPKNSQLAKEVASLELLYATHARGETLDVRRMTIERAEDLGLANDIQGRVNATQEYAAELERTRQNLQHVESLMLSIPESERASLKSNLARAQLKLLDSEKFLESIQRPLSLVSREKNTH